MPQDNGQDNLSKLYTTVKKDGYNLPEYDAFKKDMSDPNKLRKLHDNLSKDGYELPEFDKFKSDMGLGGDVKKKVSTPQATSKDIPSDIPLDGTKPSSNGGTKTPQSKSSSTSKLPSGSSYGEFTTGDILFDAKLNRNYQIQNGKRVYVKDATDNEKATLGGESKTIVETTKPPIDKQKLSKEKDLIYGVMLGKKPITELISEDNLADEKDKSYVKGMTDRFYKGELNDEDVAHLAGGWGTATSLGLNLEGVKNYINTKSKNLSKISQLTQTESVIPALKQLDEIQKQKEELTHKKNNLAGSFSIFTGLSSDKPVKDVEAQISQLDQKEKFINKGLDNLWEDKYYKEYQPELISHLKPILSEIQNFYDGKPSTSNQFLQGFGEAANVKGKVPNGISHLMKKGDNGIYQLDENGREIVSSMVAKYMSGKNDIIEAAHEHKTGLVNGQNPKNTLHTDISNKFIDYINTVLPTLHAQKKYTDEFIKKNPELKGYLGNRSNVNESFSGDEYKAANAYQKSIQDAIILETRHNFEKSLDDNEEAKGIVSKWKGQVESKMVTPEIAQKNIERDLMNNKSTSPIIKSRDKGIEEAKNKSLNAYKNYLMDVLKKQNKDIQIFSDGSVGLKGKTKAQSDSILKEFSKGLNDVSNETLGKVAEAQGKKADELIDSGGGLISRLKGTLIQSMAQSTFATLYGMTSWIYNKTGVGGDSARMFNSELNASNIDLSKIAKEHFEWKGAKSLIDPYWYLHAAGGAAPLALGNIAIGAATGGLGLPESTAATTALLGNTLFMSATNAANQYGEMLNSGVDTYTAGVTMGNRMIPELLLDGGMSYFQGLSFFGNALKPTIGKTIAKGIESQAKMGLLLGGQGYLSKLAESEAKGEVSKQSLMSYLASDDGIKQMVGGVLSFLPQELHGSIKGYYGGMRNWKNMLESSHDEFRNNSIYNNSLQYSFNDKGMQHIDNLMLLLKNEDFKTGDPKHDETVKNGITNALNYAMKLESNISNGKLDRTNVNDLYAAHNLSLSDMHNELAKQFGGESGNDNKALVDYHKGKSKEHQELGIKAMNNDATFHYLVDGTDNPVILSDKSFKVLTENGDIAKWLKDGTVKDVVKNDDKQFSTKFKEQLAAKEAEQKAAQQEKKTTTTEKPTEQQILKDINEGNLVTFTYKSKDEVPDVFKDKISSEGNVNGEQVVRVTVPKSLADYELSKGTKDGTIPTEKKTDKYISGDKFGEKPIFSDYNNTIARGGNLLPFGEEVKQRLGNGEKVTIVTHSGSRDKESPEHKAKIEEIHNTLGISDNEEAKNNLVIHQGLTDEQKVAITKANKGNLIDNSNGVMKAAEGVKDVSFHDANKLNEEATKVAQPEVEKVEPKTEVEKTTPIKAKSKLSKFKEKFVDAKVEEPKVEEKVVETKVDDERKTKQLELINKTNPAPNDYNTWIRSVDDIKTAKEVWDNVPEGDEMYPDFKKDAMNNALESGEIEVYSSYPIEDGTFITPSKDDAEDYAGGKGKKIYSKKVKLEDVAWLDESQGQFAPIKTETTKTEKVEPTVSKEEKPKEEPLTKEEESITKQVNITEDEAKRAKKASTKRTRKSKDVAEFVESETKIAESSGDAERASELLETAEAAEKSILEDNPVSESFEKKHGVSEVAVLKEISDMGKKGDFNTAYKNLTGEDATTSDAIDFLSAISSEGLKVRPKMDIEGDAENNVVKITPIKSKKKLQNKGVDSLQDIVSKDELRPAMGGIYFDNGNMVATDTQKLLVIPQTESEEQVISKIIDANYKYVKKIVPSYTREQAEKNVREKVKDGINGKILNFKNGEVVDARFPNYKYVIPDYNNPIKVDVQDLESQLNGAKTVKDNLSSGVFAASLDLNGVKVLVNPEIMLDTISSLKANGAKEFELSNGGETKALLLKTDNGQTGLVMPSMGELLRSQDIKVKDLYKEATKAQIETPETEPISEMRDIVKDYVDEGITSLDKIKDLVAEELGTDKYADTVEKAFNEYTKKETDKGISEAVIERVGVALNKMFEGGTVEMLSGEEIRDKANELENSNIKFDVESENGLNLQNETDRNEQIILKRLRTEEEQGRVKSGSLNAEATTITQGVLKSIKKAFGSIFSNRAKNALKEKTEEYITDYAKSTDRWHETPDEFGDKVSFGQEQEVYHKGDDNFVTKLNNLALNENMQEYLDRLALHNTHFPSTAYELIGFGKNEKGEFVAITKQPFIKGDVPTQQEIVDYMKGRGFTQQEELEPSALGTSEEGKNFVNDDVLVEDLHRGNVIKGENGEMFVIDPDIKLNSKDKGFDGKRTPNENEGGVSYMKSPEGKILGFTHDGKIYLNKDEINPNTPIHEAGHIWLEHAKINRPEIYDKGIKLVSDKDNPYLKEVKENDFYKKEAAKLKTQAERDEYFQHEALAAAIGDKGAQFVTEAKKASFKDWLNNLWESIKKAAGFEGISAKDLQNLSFEDFAKRAAKEILDDTTNFGKEQKTKTDVKKEGEKADAKTEGKGNVIDEGETGGESETPPPPITPPIIEPINEDNGNPTYKGVTMEAMAQIDTIAKKYSERVGVTWEQDLKDGLARAKSLYPNSEIKEAARLYTEKRYRDMEAAGGNYVPSSQDIMTFNYHLKNLFDELNSEDPTRLRSDILSDIQRTSDVLSNSKTGRSLAAYKAILLEDNNGLKVMRADLEGLSGRPLSIEEEQLTAEYWEKQKSALEKEHQLEIQDLREKSTLELERIKTEYEQKLKNLKSVDKEKATEKKRSEIIKKSAQEIADLIRKGINKDAAYSDPLLVGQGMNLVLEGVAKLVEKVGTLAGAIAKYIEDNPRFKGKEKDIEDAIFNHINLQEKKDLALSEIEKIGGDNITKEMVEKKHIKAFVDSFLTNHDVSEVIGKATNELKKILPDVTEDDLRKAYLKKDQYEIPTKDKLNADWNQTKQDLASLLQAQDKLNKLIETGKIETNPNKKKIINDKIREAREEVEKELLRQGKKKGNLSSTESVALEKASNEQSSHIDKVMDFVNKIGKDLDIEGNQNFQILGTRINDLRFNFDPSDSVEQKQSRVKEIKANVDDIISQLDKKYKDYGLSEKEKKAINVQVQGVLDYTNRLIENVRQDVLLANEIKNLQTRAKEYDRKINAFEFDENPVPTKRTKTSYELLQAQKEFNASKSSYEKLAKKVSEENLKTLKDRLMSKDWWFSNALMGLRKAYTTSVIAFSAGRVLYSGFTRPKFEALKKATFGLAVKAFLSDAMLLKAKEGGYSLSRTSIGQLLPQSLNLSRVKEYGIKSLFRGLSEDEVVNEGNRLTSIYEKSYNEFLQQKDVLDGLNEEESNYKKEKEKLDKLEKSYYNNALKLAINAPLITIGGSSMDLLFDKWVNGASNFEASNWKFNRYSYKDVIDTFGEDKKLKSVADAIGYIASLATTNLHSAFKSLSGRAFYLAAFTARMEYAIETKQDFLSTKKIEEIHLASLLDYQYGMYMQENAINKSSQAALAAIAKELPLTSSVIKLDQPVTRVPTNQAILLTDYMFGWIKAAIIKKQVYSSAKEQARQRIALLGMDSDKATLKREIAAEIYKLRPEQAALFVRHLVNGSVGVVGALLALTGAINYGGSKSFGFQEEDKKKAKEKGVLLTEQTNVFGKSIGKYIDLLAHTDEIKTMLTIAAMNNERVYNYKRGKTNLDNFLYVMDKFLKELEQQVPPAKAIGIYDLTKSVGKAVINTPSRLVEGSITHAYSVHIKRNNELLNKYRRGKVQDVEENKISEAKAQLDINQESEKARQRKKHLKALGHIDKKYSDDLFDVRFLPKDKQAGEKTRIENKMIQEKKAYIQKEGVGNLNLPLQ